MKKKYIFPTTEFFILIFATVVVWTAYKNLSYQLASVKSEVSITNALLPRNVEPIHFSRGRELPLEAILGSKEAFFKWKDKFEVWYRNQVGQIDDFDIAAFDILKEEHYKGLILKVIKFYYFRDSPLFKKEAGGVLAVPEKIDKSLPIVIAIHGHEFSPWGDYPLRLFKEENWPYEIVKGGYVVWAPVSMYHDDIRYAAVQYGGFPFVWTRIISNGLDYIKEYLSEYTNFGWGVAGLSSGGQISYFSMAYRNDLRFGVFAGADQDLEFLRLEYRVKGHPDCWDVAGINSFTSVMALLAPRPIQFQLGKNDPFYPNGKPLEKKGSWFFGTSRPQFSTEVGGNTLSVRSIYEIYGKKENFSYLIHDGGHEMVASEALKFIRSHSKK